MRKLSFQSVHKMDRTPIKQSGFSLIEIMVAALILSIGILGLVGLQVIGLKGTQQSSMKQQAMLVVQDLTERMHANKQGVINGDYEVDSNNPGVCNDLANRCDAANSVCTSAETASVDLHTVVCGYQKGNSPRTGGVKRVDAADRSPLIDGRLRVTCDVAGATCPSGNINITIDWTERQFGTEDATSDSIILNTRITP